MKESVNIFWFRRDLRIDDNAGLYHALKASKQAVGLFIFDENILDKLTDKRDARVTFLHDTITELQKQIGNLGGTLLVRYGMPELVWKELNYSYAINAVFTNRDYEQYAVKRDDRIAQLLAEDGISFHHYKDHVIFEKDEVTKDDGTSYTVFTPYSRKWKAKLGAFETSYYLKPYPSRKYTKTFLGTFKEEENMPSLKSMGFERSCIPFPKKKTTIGIIKKYDESRNFPAIDGTSKLGIHFRFGTISIRNKTFKAYPLNETYVNELIWRDFYSMILQSFPEVEQRAFRQKYESVEWINNEDHFKAWCEGRTGYPMVDAGMRELNTIGYMHNRVRIVAASFLTKHLLTDWRWGEAYFAEKLLDFDLASNNGGWQWAAGCGTDAAPYFRIFNPESQLKKFDKDLEYINRYIPEYGTDAYPDPIVDHKEARERCLAAYKSALAEI